MLGSIGKWSTVLACGILVLLGGKPDMAKADELQIGGTGASTELMKLLGEAFEAAQQDVRVQVIPSLGSSGSIAAMIDGALDVAISARPLRDKEIEQGMAGRVFARTPYGLVSSHPEPGDIAPENLAEFYRSTSANWSDGVPVRVILRPVKESDTRLLGESFPDMSEAIKAVRSRVDVPVAGTDQENLNMAAEVYGSLVGTSLAQVVTENRKLQFLSINGYAPTVKNLETGHYPYAKRFYLVTPTTPSPIVKRFTAFLMSEAGKSALRKAACIPGDL